MNPFREVNWRPGRTERRRFALSLVVGFPCIAILLIVAHRWHAGAWSFGFPAAVGAAGAAMGTVLWIFPRIALPFYVAWYAVACAIGFVVSNVVLALVYVLMFAPLGWLLRVLGRK